MGDLADEWPLPAMRAAFGDRWDIQQVSAFCLPMYPENLSHHFRQWLRWARGGSVRNYWRIRYLSPGPGADGGSFSASITSRCPR